MKLSFRTLILCWFFIITCLPLLAQKQAVIIIKNKHELLLCGAKIAYLEDKSGKLSIQDIQQKSAQNQFISSNTEVFARPASQSVYWFKINVQNHSQEHIWLEVGSTFAWYLDFYFPGQNKQYQVHQTGARLPYSSRFYSVNLFWLPLNKAGETYTKTYYLRVATQLPYELPFQVGSLQALHKNNRYHDFVTAGFVGVLLIMFLYNIFLFFYLRDYLYLLYSFYLFWSIIDTPFLNNYPFIQYILRDYVSIDWWWQYFFFWYSIPFLFIGYFCIGYLHLGEKLPIVKRIIQIELIILFGGFIFLQAIGTQIVNLITPFQLINLLFYFTCLFASIYLLFKRDKQARFFTLGWTFMIASVFVYVMVINGVLPFNIISRNAIYFGIVLEIWMFSLALGDRINILRKEKERSQKELLRQTQENARLISEQNAMLTQKVAEKTVELNQKNDRLEQANHEISTINEELTANVEELTSNLEVIKQQKELIENQQDEIKHINRNLEEKIKARTAQLQFQNEKLKVYAFKNAHKVRGPLVRVIGLMNILKIEDDEVMKNNYLQKIEVCVIELDNIIREMNNILEEANFFEEDSLE
jgi:hypothetical protein